MKRVGLVLCMLSVVFISGCKPWGVKEINTEKSAVKFAREVIRGDYKIVSTDELKQWIDEKKEMVIVDTMPLEASYNKNHIPGALQSLFPIPEMETMDEKAKAEFIKLLGDDKDRALVFYCGFTKCTRSHNGAMWAVKLGYTNVYRCPGGIKAWKEAGFKVDKG